MAADEFLESRSNHVRLAPAHATGQTLERAILFGRDVGLLAYEPGFRHHVDLHDIIIYRGDIVRNHVGSLARTRANTGDERPVGDLTGDTPVVRAVNELVRRLAASLGNDVIAVTLFGSTARGDAQSESDIDVLVLGKRSDWDFRDRVHASAMGVLPGTRQLLREGIRVGRGAPVDEPMTLV